MESEVGDCYSIVYISTAIVELEEAALLQLLKQSRSFNEQAGITGVLMYGGGRFLQVLEGSPAAVRSLYVRIEADPRHGRLEKLADGPVARREFTAWHMSFVLPPTCPDWPPLPGYLTPPQLVVASLGAASQSLLSEFMEASSHPALI